MATLVTVALLVQAQTQSKRFPDVQMDGFKGAVRTVRTEIERSTGVTEPVDESSYDEQGRLVARRIVDPALRRPITLARAANRPGSLAVEKIAGLTRELVLQTIGAA